VCVFGTTLFQQSLFIPGSAATDDQGDDDDDVCIIILLRFGAATVTGDAGCIARSFSAVKGIFFSTKVFKHATSRVDSAIGESSMNDACESESELLDVSPLVSPGNPGT
jgi:hypothetical protein